MFDSLFLRMLNKEASSPKNKPIEILERLEIGEGDAIGDIGSGGGYFALEFAKRVGKKGRVYAVDTRAKNLDFVRNRSDRGGLKNMTFVVATAEEMKLPEAGLDLVFMRNAFHHLREPAKYFQNLRRFLKPDGKVAVIEHTPKVGLSFGAMFKHFTPVEVIVREMEQAGYVEMQSFDFLPEQTFNVFRAERG